MGKEKKKTKAEGSRFGEDADAQHQGAIHQAEERSASESPLPGEAQLPEKNSPSPGATPVTEKQNAADEATPAAADEFVSPHQPLEETPKPKRRKARGTPGKQKES
ncbi:MAG TPA: hypothetical protein VEK08_10015 [Planctomycetota bacterium]|nr:hypothetical protein [Planctomycetota bacterium]